MHVLKWSTPLRVDTNKKCIFQKRDRITSLKGGVFLIVSKGQKFKKYDNKIKEKIIGELQTGTSSYYLSEKYDIPTRTNSNMEKKIY